MANIRKTQKRIKHLQTRATLLRASAATIRKRHPVTAINKEREARQLESEISRLRETLAELRTENGDV